MEKITNEMREKLREPLPQEALTQHGSKTFLTSIKPMYVIERLNDVFGVGSWTLKPSVITTKGAKVKAGDVIMQLVPIDELVIEAKLSPAEISFVNVGQKASVKLDAYDFSIYGGFDGKVKHISSDTLVEKTNKGEEFFFRVLISLNGNEITSKVGKKVVVTPGMTGQIDIITGERTVLTYLAKPVIKTLNEAFTER